MGVSTLIAFLGGLILLYIIGLILVIPLRIIAKLIINGLIGGLVLFLFNLVGGFFSFTLAINPLNSLIAGFLGVPGVVLLIVLKLIL